MTKPPDPFLSVQLPAEQKRYLTLRAAHAAMSRSELVRQLIERDAKRHTDLWKLATKKGKPNA